MNSLLRSILQSGVGLTASLAPKVRRTLKNGVSVFVFHDVSLDVSGFAERHSLTASPELFHQQVEWIAQNFNVIHPDALLGDDVPIGSAILTFDDGWAGIFRNAFPILEQMNLPAVVFLNLDPIHNGAFLASAMADYLGELDHPFGKFANENGIRPPYHLSLSPRLYADFVKNKGKAHEEKQRIDQGEMANINDLKHWDGHKLFRFGNHLFNHWNVKALSDQELTEQYTKNRDLLDTYKSSISLFAYPNGQPETCYDLSHNRTISDLGAQRMFSATGCVNDSNDKTILDRIAFTAWHDRTSRLWYGLGRKILF